ncbi:GntR family transcriptional regulator [Streptomyces sp. NPDC057239]|uniref:GntR family transcriptional regulator n=1 Tax=Streptomyces sp. NPDC057239 TaxID=3346061 RepID=UPI00362E484F
MRGSADCWPTGASSTAVTPTAWRTSPVTPCTASPGCAPPTARRRSGRPSRRSAGSRTGHAATLPRGPVNTAPPTPGHATAPLRPSALRGPSLPACQQAAADPRRQILSGRLEPGERLPVVRSLQQQYAVAAMTARAALHVPRAEGLVDVVQGIRREPGLPGFTRSAGAAAA